MKRAVTLPAYRDTQPFEMPPGVVQVTIDPESMQLATPECPITREEVYIQGTEPTEFCSLHGGRMATEGPPGSWLSRVFGGDKSKDADPNQTDAPGGAAVRPSAKSPGDAAQAPPSADNQQPDDANKKGVLRGEFLVSLVARRTPISHSRERQDPQRRGGVFRRRSPWTRNSLSKV